MTPVESGLLGILLGVLTAVGAVSLAILLRPRVATAPQLNPLLYFDPTIPRAPHLVPSQAAESTDTIMANFFATLLQKFVAPEEHSLGKIVAASYAANKGSVISALGANEAKITAVLEADAKAWIKTAFNAVPDGALLYPILGGAAEAEADALIVKAVAAAGGLTPLAEVYADKVVAGVVSYLEAA